MGNRGSKVVGVTYSQSRDVPSDGRGSGRGVMESLRRMRVSEALDNHGFCWRTHWIASGSREADTLFVAA